MAELDVHTDAGEDTPTPIAADLEADIAQRREQLAHTIDQLSARLDVKSRIRSRATRTKADAKATVRHAKDRIDEDPRVVIVAVAGVAVGFVVTAVVLRRRGGRR